MCIAICVIIKVKRVSFETFYTHLFVMFRVCQCLTKIRAKETVTPCGQNTPTTYQQHEIVKRNRHARLIDPCRQLSLRFEKDSSPTLTRLCTNAFLSTRATSKSRKDIPTSKDTKIEKNIRERAYNRGNLRKSTKRRSKKKGTKRWWYFFRVETR